MFALYHPTPVVYNLWLRSTYLADLAALAQAVRELGLTRGRAGGAALRPVRRV